MSTESATLPEHSQSCTPLKVLSGRFTGEPRYLCVSQCPRKRWLAKELAEEGLGQLSLDSQKGSDA